MRAFLRNKVSNFKSAQHKRNVNKSLVGLFIGQKVTELVNNKGMSTKNVRYNPDVIVIPQHNNKYLYNGK